MLEGSVERHDLKRKAIDEAAVFDIIPSVGTSEIGV